MQPYSYDGPPAGAILVRNLQRDTKTIDLPIMDGDQVKRGPGGKMLARRLTLGSTLDADLEAATGKRVGPEALVARADWERMKAIPAIKGWLKARGIEAVSPIE